LVDGRLHGKGTRHFFFSKAEANTKADQLVIERKNQGAVAVVSPERLRVEALEADERLRPYGATITEAVDYFLKHAKPPAGGKSLKQTIELFMRTKRQEGLRPTYLRIQESVLGYFAATFGERAVHEIGHVEIKEWLLSQSWALRTRRNRQRDLGNLFGFAIREGLCALNPISRLGVPKFEEPPPGILTVDQVGALLKVTSTGPAPLLPFTAIGLFAGLRTAELERLDWREIDLTHRTIEVTAQKAKTRARRIVDISDNLASWLASHTKASGPVAPLTYSKAFTRARKAAGIDPWPHNALRHSFASYHLAHHRNAHATALQLGHHSTSQLFASYRELVKPKDATAFWELAPLSR
jgi:integrase